MNEIIYKIDNPNDDVISSCIIYEDTNYNEKVIKIKKYNSTNFKTIYQTNLNEVICFEKINSKEIECILSFINFNKYALNIFNDYLKYNSKQKKSKIVFEEFKEDIYCDFDDIQCISFSNSINSDMFEKYITIKQNNNWKNIYYGCFNESGIILEMVKDLSFEQIDKIREILINNKKALKEFDKCIIKEKQLIKKY